MVKCPVLFIASLTVLVFIVGCPPKETELVKPKKIEPVEIKVEKVEPIEVKPEIQPVEVKTEIIEIKPEINEPVKIKAETIEPNKIEPEKIVPSKSETPKQERPKPKPQKIEPAPNVLFLNKYAEILSNFVSSDGLVDYKRLKKKRSKLRILLNEFKNLDTKKYNSWPKEEKIAFWINAYNIRMLSTILQNYPIESSRLNRLLRLPSTSIRNIKGGLKAIWNDYKIIIMDEAFTLRLIENRFFRKEFDEPRVFFALTMASLSSPPLRNEPYYRHKLYNQLDNQVRKFLADPKAFKIDRKKQKVYLSSILKPKLHGKDFVGKYGTNKKFKDKDPIVRSVLNFLTNYTAERDTFFLETENYTVEYINYDWRLNDSSEK